MRVAKLHNIIVSNLLIIILASCSVEKSQVEVGAEVDAQEEEFTTSGAEADVLPPYQTYSKWPSLPDIVTLIYTREDKSKQVRIVSLLSRLYFTGYDK